MWRRAGQCRSQDVSYAGVHTDHLLTARDALRAEAYHWPPLSSACLHERCAHRASARRAGSDWQQREEQQMVDAARTVMRKLSPASKAGCKERAADLEEAMELLAEVFFSASSTRRGPD